MQKQQQQQRAVWLLRLLAAGDDRDVVLDVVAHDGVHPAEQVPPLHLGPDRPGGGAALVAGPLSGPLAVVVAPPELQPTALALGGRHVGLQNGPRLPRLAPLQQRLAGLAGVRGTRPARIQQVPPATHFQLPRTTRCVIYNLVSLNCFLIYGWIFICPIF